MNIHENEYINEGNLEVAQSLFKTSKMGKVSIIVAKNCDHVTLSDHRVT